MIDKIITSTLFEPNESTETKIHPLEDSPKPIERVAKNKNIPDVIIGISIRDMKPSH
jgi:hypothetical protein